MLPIGRHYCHRKKLLLDFRVRARNTSRYVEGASCRSHRTREAGSSAATIFKGAELNKDKDKVDLLLAQLLAIEQIKQLKARYSCALDTKDWSGAETLFTEDFTGEVSNAGKSSSMPDKTMKGGKEWVAASRDAILENDSIHHIMLPNIEITSPSEAKGTWVGRFGFKAQAGADFRSVDGYGHYYDTYEYVSARWLFKSIKLSILFVEVT